MFIIFRYSSPKLKEKKLNKNFRELKVQSFVIEGDIEFYKEEYKKAIIYWDKALELNPKSSDALNGKGAILSNRGKHSEAIQYFDKALEYNPNDVTIWMNKGITYTSTEGISSVSEEQTASMEEITATASRLGTLAEELKERLGQSVV